MADEVPASDDGGGEVVSLVNRDPAREDRRGRLSSVSGAFADSGACHCPQRLPSGIAARSARMAM